MLPRNLDILPNDWRPPSREDLDYKVKEGFYALKR